MTEERPQDASIVDEESVAQSGSHFEESLLSLADVLSEDESDVDDESKQLRKRRASNHSIVLESKLRILDVQHQDQGTCTPKHKRRKRNKCRSDRDSLTSKMVVRPNYFVGIQISNPEIHRAVHSLQEKIVKLEPALHSTVIPTAMLHITLAVANLPDPAHVARAADVMKESISLNRELYQNPPVRLNFSGVKTFGNQVLFADIEGGESLVRIAGLAQCIEDAFKESGFVIPSRKNFKPHLTILKLSKDFKLKKKGVVKITPSLYSDDKSMQFGHQVVKSVQLLSMNKPKDANGYYYCSHEEHFDVDSEESSDHSECCWKQPVCEQPTATRGSLAGSSCVSRLEDQLRRRLHSLAAPREGPEPAAPTMEDIIKLLLLVGAASISAAFLLRSLSSSK